ncbi:Alpha-L-fucosidase [Purpureocillium takamizusanense]|uniref:alpha-L-fucosidase n=1 Tax=Purpureocillium takamizusanense TaxID=2060973 RepID=A0A9Q8Q897_9HYPO|nr:Alpha-L-fucosidase [Purpureocillium takamizusanense]UNI15413.1 Alpha-L-fucosidase [Purpureocillium takamizusanense]
MFLSSLLTGSLLAALAHGAALTAEPAGDMMPRTDSRGPVLSIVAPNMTSKWLEKSDYVQIIEMFVENTDDREYVTAAHGLQISVKSSSLDTLVPGTLKRLAPKQSAIVQVGVKNKPGVKPGTACSADIVPEYRARHGGPAGKSAKVSGSCGIGDFEESVQSVQSHRSPDWFNDAKYGIFIHWGVYSAPAYGNVGDKENYAEWYWKWMNSKGDKTATYEYHLETYGKDFNYDDFFSNFTDKKFDPKAWVDLFSDAGAQYFVPTTKHHDGFALFNFSESISRRSSVHYGPKRDFIGDLFAAARKHQPHLRLGTYFSMPEWYNPAYKPYAKDSFLGGPPTNPYTGAELEYTGYVDVNDFVRDIQLPQMNTLAYEYSTDILWCDISGSPNNMTIMAAPWLNWARDHGRQVAFNSRCGLTGDFDTPEYTTNNETVEHKWESSRGMDPHSYGYNYQTPDDKYLTGENITRTLVDIVSKNGNFLLDIGPAHDGSIPEIMQKGLRDAGRWIKGHGEAIFNTRYWKVTPGLDPLRYTTTSDAFYIHHLGAPPASLSISEPVPYLPGDKVTVVGGSQHGKKVPVSWDGIGKLTLKLGDEIVKGDEYVWTFKIEYKSGDCTAPVTRNE